MPPKKTSEKNYYAILSACDSKKTLDKTYKALAKKAHPDKESFTFIDLKAAYDQVRQEKEWKADPEHIVALFGWASNRGLAHTPVSDLKKALHTTLEREVKPHYQTRTEMLTAIRDADHPKSEILYLAAKNLAGSSKLNIALALIGIGGGLIMSLWLPKTSLTHPEQWDYAIKDYPFSGYVQFTAFFQTMGAYALGALGGESLRIRNSFRLLQTFIENTDTSDSHTGKPCIRTMQSRAAQWGINMLGVAGMLTFGFLTGDLVGINWFAAMTTMMLAFGIGSGFYNTSISLGTAHAIQKATGGIELTEATPRFTQKSGFLGAAASECTSLEEPLLADQEKKNNTKTLILSVD